MPVSSPIGDAASYTRPANIMPAFYALWAQLDDDAAGRAFWVAAAQASRVWLVENANEVTGFHPSESEFDGTWRAGGYGAESCVVIMHMALDQMWHGENGGAVDVANRQLEFLAANGGVDNYVSCWEVDGSAATCDYHANWAAATNSVGAAIATSPVATQYLQLLWDTPLLSGDSRYYENSLTILALLMTSGRFFAP